ncbi:class I SAM-dependent methyltransferase [Oligoflexus tunisiensis]|uniref:class I SAM-dependent methyltransferase n=1 Tax=Oligoflexus tunisiensis TaxID=708132 RepID=UPI000ADBD185|nr:class I SAM-dependent methyltransferase [Oligoflexus tunisiensis]
MRKTPILFVGSLLAACTTTSPTPEATPSTETKREVVQQELPKTLEEAVASPFRTPQNMQRDIYRHPVETLKFFGIKPNMTVVEIWPGAGWYAQILAPYLSNQGTYVAAIVPPEKNEYFKKAYDTLSGWAAQHPNVKMNYVSFTPPDITNFAKPESADLVLTFRNVHNWTSNDSADEAFKAFYTALKPGGILGVVEHRANEKTKMDPKDKSGYVKESEVIRLATKAGFKLDAKSEINANPKDTKNYPQGVWTLPPTLALKDQDRAKYLAIGESDRMTLRFIKPKK